MPIIQELLNGGVVTARDPSLLKEGELQQADDCILRPRTPAVFKAPGRTRYGQPTGGAGAVKGLRHLAFDGNTDILLSYVGAAFQSSPYIGSTGTFTNVPGVGTLPNDGTEFLDVIQYSNAFYTIQGNGYMRRLAYVNPSTQVVASCTIAGDGVSVTTSVTAGFNAVVVGQAVSGTGVPAGAVVTSKTSSTAITITASTPGAGITLTFASTPFLQARIAGLDPVSAFDSTQVTTVAGTWNSSADMGTGYYWFLYTEMFMPGKIDDPSTGFVESSFTGSIQVGNIADVTTDCIRITRGVVVNSAANGRNDATHWQVYMSAKQLDATEKPSLATFRRVGGPIPIGTSSIDLRDDVVSQGPLQPSANAAITGHDAFDNPTGAHSIHDGSNASSTSNTAAIALRNYGFTNNSLSVLGIEVEVFGRADPSGSASTRAAGYIRLKTQSGTKVSLDYRFEFGTSWATVLLGSPTDTWSPNAAWTAADFTNANFELYLLKAGSGSTQRLTIDGVRMKIYYTGTSINRNGAFFKTITLTSQVGVTISEPAQLPPPTASTGDIFDGQLVLNNVSKPALVQYSLPDAPEYFPGSYYINFESKKKDRVTCIKRVGNVLVVGLQSSIKRVNYLPRESDAEFDRGRSQEDIANDHGMAGPLGACLFDMPGLGVVLAYVSYKGLHITDGITTRELNIDLDWAATVNLGVDGNGVPYLQQCMLENYASEYALRLAYIPAGQTTTVKYLQFSYHPMHMKGSFLPAMGPCNVNARAYTTAILNGVPKLLSGHPTDGYVYLEDSGDVSIDATATLAPSLRTRLLFPRGLGGQGRIQRVYLRVGAAGDATTGNVTVGSQRQNINETLADQATTYTFNTVVASTKMVHLDTFGEALVVKISKTNLETAALRLDVLAYQTEDGGQESHRS